MPIKDSMYTAPFLRTYRTEMDWSQTKLFEASGVARRTITRAENGEKVSQEILEKLSKAMGLTHWTELVDNRSVQTDQHTKIDITLKIVKSYLKTLWQSHVLTLIVLFYLFVTGGTADAQSLAGYCLLTSSLIVPLANLLNYQHFSIERPRSLPLSQNDIELSFLRKRYSHVSMIVIGLVTTLLMFLIQDKHVLASYGVWYLLTTGLIIKSTQIVMLNYK